MSTPDELWSEAGKLGFIGVNLPEEYGGGGAGMYELSMVMEEMSAAGSRAADDGRLPAINGTDHLQVRHRDEQKEALDPRYRRRRRSPWPSPSPNLTPARTATRITTTARRDGSDWILKWPEGVHLRRRPGAGRARRRPHRGPQDRQPQAGAVRRPDATRPGLSWTKIDMEIVSPESQFQVFLDDVRLPRRRAGRFRGRRDRAVVRRAEPRAHHGRGQRGGRRPLRHQQGRRLRRRRARSGRRRSARTRASRIRWRRTTSRWSWPS